MFLMMLCTFLLFLLSYLHEATSSISEVTRRRCSNQGDFYPDCQVRHEVVGLFCDNTNLTRVPMPDSSLIDTQINASLVAAIHMNHSCMSEINSNVLKRYIRLEKLYCSSNQLTSIGPRAFSNNPLLLSLILSDNAISFIDVNAFAGLRHLRILSLKSNFIRDINSKIFRFLNRLQTLDLSNNQISRLKYSPFHHLSQLESLNMAGNNLQRIRSKQLSRLRKLKILNLSCNNLTTLPRNLFHSLSNLTSVDLSNNSISCLPRTIFQRNNKMTNIVLRANQLRVPRWLWFDDVIINNRPHLFGSDSLSDNPWNCGCESYSYWESLVSLQTNVEWQYRLDVPCSSSSNARDELLGHLTRDYFTRRKCTLNVEDCPSQTLSSLAIEKYEDHGEETTIVPSSAPRTSTHFLPTISIKPEFASQNKNNAEARKSETTNDTFLSNFMPMTWVILIAVLVTATCVFSIFLFNHIKHKQLKLSNQIKSPALDNKQSQNIENPDKYFTYSGLKRDSGFVDSLAISREPEEAKVGSNEKQIIVIKQCLSTPHNCDAIPGQNRHQSDDASSIAKTRNRYDSGTFSISEQFEPILSVIEEQRPITDERADEDAVVA